VEKIIFFAGSPIWDPEFNGKTPAHVIAAAQAAQATEAAAGSYRRHRAKVVFALFLPGKQRTERHVVQLYCTSPVAPYPAGIR
jgi:hypothetical protein